MFLDESSARTNLTRLYGWSGRGERCVDRTPQSHWKTLTLLSAMRLEGVIAPASVVLDGTLNAPTFLGYVQQCLAPALRQGDVVVMDNLAAHKVRGVQEAIEQVGASVWYLPPYSPDLNPIEKLWSKVKAWLRRAVARDFESLLIHIGSALQDVDAQECRNYLASCGYGQK